MAIRASDKGFTFQEACAFAEQMMAKGITVFSIGAKDGDNCLWVVHMDARLTSAAQQLYHGSRIPLDWKWLSAVAAKLGVSIIDLFEPF